MRRVIFCIMLFIAMPAYAGQKLACGGFVAPGLVYPDADGNWSGLKIPLHEFARQETDEMHDAHGAGRCDAITARISLRIGRRVNEDSARRDDVVLPDSLGDNTIRLAPPSGQPAWAAPATKTIQESSHVY